MYLSRLTLNRSQMATLWSSNPYRVHQRLKMANENDPRLLFRIEENDQETCILVQTHNAPDWQAAFSNFDVLNRPAEQKSIDLNLQAGRLYRFRLLANPAVKKTIEGNGQKRKTRLGLFREEDQRTWLERKLQLGGSELLECQISGRGLFRSRKNPAKDEKQQTHLGVLFEGVLRVNDPVSLKNAIFQGLGPGKGYGFGLLSLAPA